MQKPINKMSVKTKIGVNNGVKKAESDEAAQRKVVYMASKQFVPCPQCSGKGQVRVNGCIYKCTRCYDMLFA